MAEIRFVHLFQEFSLDIQTIWRAVDLLTVFIKRDEIRPRFERQEFNLIDSIRQKLQFMAYELIVVFHFSLYV